MAVVTTAAHAKNLFLTRQNAALQAMPLHANLGVPAVGGRTQ